MKSTMLNATWLETFVTLCETGHFTRAAKLLNMTQPGVTQHIKKLEDQVGQPLITREGKSFTPTPAGETVLALGRKRREEEKRLQDQLRTDDPARGVVNIACSGSLALLLYPKFLERMAQAPDLILRLEATPQSHIIDGVTEGRFDLGIVDHAPAHFRLDGEKIGHDELCLIQPKGARRQPRFADLEKLGFIAHPDGYAYADELLGVNFPESYPGADRLHQRSFINQIGQIPEPVLRGLGYTILPRSCVNARPGHKGIQIADLPHPVRHALWLIRLKGRTLPARIETIRVLIRETVCALN